jgi:hypothetical protein
MLGVFQPRQAVEANEHSRRLLLRSLRRRCAIELWAVEPAKLAVGTWLNRAIAGRRNGLQRLDIRCVAVQFD